MDPSRLRSRWQRLTHDTAFRVATLYAGASWFAIEAADTLGASTALIRTLALVLAAGFLVLVPAVWLLTRRAAQQEEAEHAATETDAHWGLGPSTGPRRARGGTRRWAVAVGALVVLALGTWWVGTRQVEGAVPSAATRLAVLPFHVSGPESVSELGVGLVDLLSAAMDDVAGIRTVPSRTVLARTGDGTDGLASEDALRVGDQLGAGSVLTGSVTAISGRVRLNGQVRSVADGTVMATAEAEGPQDSILSLTDQLAVSLLRELWQSTEPIPAVRTAALTTSSPAALRAYLRGERLLREMQVDSAVEAFGEAVAADSTFALAWLRLSEGAGWQNPVDEAQGERAAYVERAARHAGRLPSREQSLVRASALDIEGELAAFDSLESYVQRYPDDPYGWYLLGDARFHGARLGLHTRQEIVQPFLQAHRLDPTFALGLTHALDMALSYGDRDQFESLLPRYADMVAEERVEQLRQDARLRWSHPDSVVATFLEPLREMGGVPDRQDLNSLVGTLGNRTRLDLEVDPLAYATAIDSSRSIFAGDRQWQQRSSTLIVLNLLALGRVDEAEAAIDHLASLGPAQGGLPVPPRLQGPLWRVMWSISFDLPEHMVADQVALLEDAADQAPIIGTVLHFHHLRHGRTQRAAQYDPRLGAGTPPEDSAAVALAFQGWKQLLSGDSVGGAQKIGDAIGQLGYMKVEAVEPAVFPYAVHLSQNPATRDRGIRMLEWATTFRSVEPGQAYLALGRAYEAAGDLEAARTAYAHVIRLWEGADAHWQDEVREARAALVRLTQEG